jgi:hypothetical protein
VPFLTLALAVAGCGDDVTADVEATETPEAFEAGAAWATAYSAHVTDISIDDESGEIVIVDEDGVSRIDADGKLVFRLPRRIRTNQVAFLPGGHTLLLSSEGTGILIEVDHAGSVVREEPIAWTSGATAYATALAVGDDGAIHVGGGFTTVLGAAGVSLEADGGQDLFYLRLDASWEPEVLQGFDGDSGRIHAIAVDDATDEAVLVGRFNGRLRMSDLYLSAGPSGAAIFTARLDRSGEARWADHWAGSGDFDVRIDDDGTIVVSGAMTSVGGSGSGDDPFAMRMTDTGDELWSWRIPSVGRGSRATVDAEGRVLALYTKRLESAGTDTCTPGELPGEACSLEPPRTEHQRTLIAVDPDDDMRVLSKMVLGTAQARSDYDPYDPFAGAPGESFGSGMIAATPDGAALISDHAEDVLLDLGDGPTFADVLAKIAVVAP